MYIYTVKAQKNIYLTIAHCLLSIILSPYIILLFMTAPSYKQKPQGGLYTGKNLVYRPTPLNSTIHQIEI